MIGVIITLSSYPSYECIKGDIHVKTLSSLQAQDESSLTLDFIIRLLGSLPNPTACDFNNVLSFPFMVQFSHQTEIPSEKSTWSLHFLSLYFKHWFRKAPLCHHKFHQFCVSGFVYTSLYVSGAAWLAVMWGVLVKVRKCSPGLFSAQIYYMKCELGKKEISLNLRMTLPNPLLSQWMTKEIRVWSIFITVIGITVDAKKKTKKR